MDADGSNLTNLTNNAESSPIQFASLVLVSNQEFIDGLEDRNIQGYRESWADSTLDDLSKSFLVSRDVVAIRLEQLGYAPEGFYARRRSHWDSIYKETSGFALGGRTKIGHAREKIGNSTLDLVYHSVKNGGISVVDAASFIGEVRESRTGAPWKMTVRDIEKWMQ